MAATRYGQGVHGVLGDNGNRTMENLRSLAHGLENGTLRPIVGKETAVEGCGESACGRSHARARNGKIVFLSP